jgi:hypothetical protein
MINKKVAPFVENISESTVACLVAMVQGNVLSIGIGHLLIASQTGLAAGAITAIAILVSKTHKRWVVSLLFGVVTTVVDYLVHPGMIGGVFTEAIITGVGAAVLSYLIGMLIDAARKRKSESEVPAD